MDGPAGIYVVADLAGAPSGAIAPLIGAWMVDLFAARHFALTHRTVQSDSPVIGTCAQYPRTRFRFLDLRPHRALCLPMAGAYPGTWARRQHFVGVRRGGRADAPSRSGDFIVPRMRLNSPPFISGRRAPIHPDYADCGRNVPPRARAWAGSLRPAKLSMTSDQPLSSISIPTKRPITQRPE